MEPVNPPTPPPTAPSISPSSSKATTLTLDFKPAVSKFISLATTSSRETAAFGTRGDGKTWGAFGTMIVHAQRHHELGYPLPTRWAGVTDTFQAHKLKTVRSLQDAGWGGLWRFRDDYHVAECVLDGTVLVHLDLFGIEDQGAMDRLRMEMHGLWFEEPAPASVMVQSSGVNEGAWLMGLTSQRIPSYHHPAIMTLNYPDEDHWTWQRFVANQEAGTNYVRIPPGERASAESRAEWTKALASRPDLLRRLLEGKPGTLMLGEQVATGFNEDVHAVPGTMLKPERNAVVSIGQDGGLTPTTVIGQRLGPHVNILAALTTEHGGIRQHVQYLLRPWLAEHTPWALSNIEALKVYYDPSMNKDDEGDSESNSLKVMRAQLMGGYHAGAVRWEPRKNPMLAVFNALVAGEPVLRVDPVQARGLVKALNGGWHYPTGPDGKVSREDPVKNHPHSDFGDAFAYLIGGLAPLRDHEGEARRYGRMQYAQSGLVDYRDQRAQRASAPARYAASRLT